MAFVGTAAFPGLAHKLRWRTRLRGRGLLLYIAANTLEQYAIRTYLLPRLKRLAEEQQQLRDRLDREPTKEEIREHFGRGRGPASTSGA